MISLITHNQTVWSRWMVLLAFVLFGQSIFAQSISLTQQETAIAQPFDCSGSAIVEYKLILKNTSPTQSVVSLRIIHTLTASGATFVPGSFRYVAPESNPTTAPTLKAGFNPITAGGDLFENGTGLLAPGQQVTVSFRVNFALNNSTVNISRIATARLLNTLALVGSAAFSDSFTLPNFNSGAQALTVNHCNNWQSEIQDWLNTGGNASITLNGYTLNCITSDYFDNTITGWVSNGCGSNQFRDVRFTGKYTNANGQVIMNSWCGRVTLVDNTAPQFDMLPMDKTITCTPGSSPTADLQMWLNNFGGAWVGACAGTLVKTNDFTGTLACNTPRVVKFTATDHCGRSSAATATVTFVDNTAPTISGVPANASLTCFGAFPPPSGVTAADNCGNATLNLTRRVENISTVMSGSQEVPARATNATGTLTATLSANNELSLSGSYSGLTTPVTVAHLHSAVFGSNGPVSIDLIPNFMTAGATSGTISGSTTLTAAQATALLSGGMYINIHTSTYPGGEIRGQLGGCARMIRNWVATDDCGNTATASQTLTVNDATAPTITNVPANTTITCPATASFAAPTFADNCGVYATSFSDATVGGPCPVGSTITRTWVVTDMCGNTATATSRITVVTNSVVTMNCSPDITVNATGTTGAVVTFSTPTASTTCTTGSITITQIAGPASGSTFPVGTTQVCFRATDGCGATSSCCFNVVVTAQPSSTVTINCPANISITATTGATSAVVTFGTPTASSTNCPGTPTVTQISGPASGASFPVGTTQVCFRATNTCGASSSCCFNVTVTGSTVNPPAGTASINCPANIVMTAPIGATGMVVNFTAPLGSTTCTQTGTLNVVQIAGPASGSLFPIGTTQVCYRVTDACGGTASCCFNVTVNGSTPGGSNITLTIPPNITIACGQTANLPLATSSTTCPAGGLNVTFVDATNGTSCTGITYTRTYTATDACGNNLVRTYTITQTPDNIPPVFTSLPPQDQMINCGAPINYGNAIATDCSPNVAVTFTVTNNGATSCNTVNGITYGYDLYVHWVARDICGNQTTATTNIWVLPGTNIGFLSKPADKDMACSDQMVFEAPMPKSFVADIVNIDYVDDYNLDACGSGTVTRTWTATDAIGNTCQAEQTMTILPDTEKPTISLPFTYTTVDCAGNLPTFTPTVGDNCTYKDDLVITTIDKQWGSTIERTYVVSDACGNVNAAILTIGLTDNLAPQFSAIQAEKTISCNDAIVFDTPTATDACSVKSLTHVDQVQQGTCSTTHTRVWTATDLAGNASQAQQKINVIDTQAPQFTTQPTAKSVSCASDIAFDAVAANDLCRTATIYHNDAQTTPICGNSGYTVTRTWTANDGCNNIAQISQAITVAEDISAPSILTNLPATVELTTAQANAWQPAQISTSDNCNASAVTVTNTKTVIDHCNFDVTYTVTDACGNATTATQKFQIIDGTCASVSGTGAIADATFQVYPNPVVDRMVLDLSDSFSFDKLVCEVISIDGTRVYMSNLTRSKSELNLAHLQSGTYFVRLTNAAGVASLKFVKIAR